MEQCHFKSPNWICNFTSPTFSLTFLRLVLFCTKQRHLANWWVQTYRGLECQNFDRWPEPESLGPDPTEAATAEHKHRIISAQNQLLFWFQGITKISSYHLQVHTPRSPLLSHLQRFNSPASCSRSARGCARGWRELPGLRALPGPTWTDDWKTGPGNEGKMPNPGNTRPPVRRAERKQETLVSTPPVCKLVWKGAGSVPGCGTGRARWAETD